MKIRMLWIMLIGASSLQAMNNEGARGQSQKKARLVLGSYSDVEDIGIQPKVSTKALHKRTPSTGSIEKNTAVSAQPQMALAAANKPKEVKKPAANKPSTCQFVVILLLLGCVP